jgi:flagellar P-ring protein precursor FlgI
MSRRPSFYALALLVLAVLLAHAGFAAPAHAATRVGDLTLHAGEVPARLVGYGIVTGLDGTGDRSFGGTNGSTPTVKSVINLLRRFNIDVPDDELRLRNVAAVLVTAEVSPYLRAGGRFEVQVSALGDATSLRGGVLWITPLLSDPDDPPVATAQGAVYTAIDDDSRSLWARRVNSGRITEGGLLETELPAAAAPTPRLLLRSPDLGTANRISEAVIAAFGAGAASVDDPGALTLKLPSGAKGSLMSFLAAVDTLAVDTAEPARVVIDARQGTVVAGGDVRVGHAVVSHHGITLEVGGAESSVDSTGVVRMKSAASVQDVAAGLHAAGARPAEMAAIFEALHSAGALAATVVIR